MCRREMKWRRAGLARRPILPTTLEPKVEAPCVPPKVCCIHQAIDELGLGAEWLVQQCRWHDEITCRMMPTELHRMSQAPTCAAREWVSGLRFATPPSRDPAPTMPKKTKGGVRGIQCLFAGISSLQGRPHPTLAQLRGATGGRSQRGGLGVPFGSPLCLLPAPVTL